MIDIIDDDILMIGSQFIVGRGTTFTIYEKPKSMSAWFCIDCNRENISTIISLFLWRTNIFFNGNCCLCVKVPRTRTSRPPPAHSIVKGYFFADISDDPEDITWKLSLCIFLEIIARSPFNSKF
jgi:hypothetical protein